MNDVAATVRMAGPADDDAWDAFVRARGDATPYHTTAWRKVVAVLGHRPLDLIGERNGVVSGILPLCLMKGLRGRMLVSVAGASYASALVADAQTRDALSRAAVDLAWAQGVGSLELRSLDAVAPEGFESVSPCVRVMLPIPAQPYPATVPKETRRQLRIAERTGLEIVSGASPEEMYEPYLAAVDRIGSPAFDVSFFRAMTDAFGKDATVFVARTGGRAVASELWLRVGTVAFSTFGGATTEGRGSRAGYALLDAALRFFPEHGVGMLDLGRSFRRSASLEFKRGWGGRVEPVYFHLRSVRGRSHAPLDPEAPLMRLASAAWRWLPRIARRRLGPFLSRRLH